MHLFFEFPVEERFPLKRIDLDDRAKTTSFALDGNSLSEDFGCASDFHKARGGTVGVNVYVAGFVGCMEVLRDVFD